MHRLLRGQVSCPSIIVRVRNPIIESCFLSFFFFILRFAFKVFRLWYHPNIITQCILEIQNVASSEKYAHSGRAPLQH